MLNNTDVYIKTQKGFDEIDLKRKGTLVREARTLLIMINGKKNLSHYKKTLIEIDFSNVPGGLEYYFRILLDGGYITNKAVAGATLSSLPQAVESSKALDVQDKPVQAIKQEPLVSTPAPQATPSSVVNFEDFVPAATNIEAAESLNEMRTYLAEYIEESADLKDSWGYMFKLEECVTKNDFLALTKELENETGSTLPGKISKLSKKL